MHDTLKSHSCYLCFAVRNVIVCKFVKSDSDPYNPPYWYRLTDLQLSLLDMIRNGVHLRDQICISGIFKNKLLGCFRIMFCTGTQWRSQGRGRATPQTSKVVVKTLRADRKKNQTLFFANFSKTGLRFIKNYKSS